MSEPLTVWDGSDQIPSSDITKGLARRGTFSQMTTTEQLQYLVARKMPVYVVNKTTRPASIISLSIVIPATGKSEAVVIPAIPYPFCLTDYVPANALPESRDLIQIVNKGHLSILAPKTAEDILSDPDAREIVNRETRKIQEGSARISRGDQMKAEAELADKQIALKESPWITNLLTKFESNELPAGQLLLELKARQHTMTEADLSFVIGKVSQTRVQEWCKQQLAGKRSGSPKPLLTDDATLAVPNKS